MTNVIFSVLKIICFVFLLVGKIFAGMWEIMPGNLFCAVLYSSRPLALNLQRCLLNGRKTLKLWSLRSSKTGWMQL